MIALFPSGGPSGRQLEELLSPRASRLRRFRSRDGRAKTSTSRRNRRGGSSVSSCRAPSFLRAESEALLDAVERLEPFPDFLVASGSLPPGVPDDFPARLARLARGRGKRFVVDASGPALARALEEGVFLCKASLREFREWTGEPESDEAAWRRQARRVVQDGRCEVLVISLGAAGALWTSRDEQERLASPVVPVASSVGAGDSMVGGIVFSLCRGRSLSEAMRFGARGGRRVHSESGDATLPARGRREARRVGRGSRRLTGMAGRTVAFDRVGAMKSILEVARSIDLAPEDLELYGPYKAKLRNGALAGKAARGSLVLVSAITPTPAGEGKTTTSIGLAQGLAQIGVRAAVALREPSLGPYLGMKGGGTGGGASQVVPVGRHQPPLHRRHPRGLERPQPARRAASTTTCTTATRSASIRAVWSGGACST